MPAVVRHINARLEDIGLTNLDIWALQNIHEAMPMKELAECMDFDPSYVTGVVDRLESLGLVVRQADPLDRRVKRIVLTSEGQKLKSDVPELIWAGQNTFSSLTNKEVSGLAAIVNKVAVAIDERGDG